jgi:hypothetical protein
MELCLYLAGFISTNVSLLIEKPEIFKNCNMAICLSNTVLLIVAITGNVYYFSVL